MHERDVHDKLPDLRRVLITTSARLRILRLGAGAERLSVSSCFHTFWRFVTERSSIGFLMDQ